MCVCVCIYVFFFPFLFFICKGTPHGETCLMRAAAHGQAKVLEYILNRNGFFRKLINAQSTKEIFKNFDIFCLFYIFLFTYEC